MKLELIFIMSSIISLFITRNKNYRIERKIKRRGRRRRRRRRPKENIFEKLLNKIRIPFICLKQISERSTQKHDSFSENYIETKLKKCRKAIWSIIVFSILYNYLKYFNYVNIEDNTFIFLLIMLWLVTGCYMLFNYRYVKGYYGMNYTEAKDLIYFIKQLKNNNNNTKGKKIFNENKEKVSMAGEVIECLQ